MNKYYIGIDGGGSNLRVVVVTSDLEVVAESYGAGVNPGVVGHEAAAHEIQTRIREILTVVPAEHIAGIGIGVAGAAMTHSADWLYEIVRAILPSAYIVPSSDMEIALVGAHGRRCGILLLAGTGSVAYGVNEKGEVAQVGGWGYLIGDEGSGYWIGRACLNALTRMADGRHESNSDLIHAVLQALNIPAPQELVRWLYHSEVSRIREIAALAPLVIARAEADDPDAKSIVEQAASYLHQHVQAVVHRLDMNQPAIAFAGGLLTNSNFLTTRLGAMLQLATLPQALYPPVIGAALLAKSRSEE